MLLKIHGKGYEIMKRMGYKGEGPMGKNNKGLIDPIETKFRRPNYTIGLGFKKISFHLRNKKFILVQDKMIEILYEDDTFPFQILQDISNILHDHVEKTTQVKIVERNDDFDEKTLVNKLTYDGLGIIPIIDLGY